MKKYSFFYYALLLFVVIILAGCKSGSGPEDTTPVALAGTKWKLTKLTHTQTKAERPIYIGDDICTKFVPTMDFETDSAGILRISEPHDPIPFDFRNTKLWFYILHWKWVMVI